MDFRGQKMPHQLHHASFTAKYFLWPSKKHARTSREQSHARRHRNNAHVRLLPLHGPGNPPQSAATYAPIFLAAHLAGVPELVNDGHVCDVHVHLVVNTLVLRERLEDHRVGHLRRRPRKARSEAWFEDPENPISHRPANAILSLRDGHSPRMERPI